MNKEFHVNLPLINSIIASNIPGSEKEENLFKSARIVH